MKAAAAAGLHFLPAGSPAIADGNTGGQPAMAKELPNLVVIYPDQLRRQAIGGAGSDPVLTPNLDRFAAESLNCTEAISNCPLCSPFRAMFHTGAYPDAAGVVDNCHSSPEAASTYLRSDRRCLSDVLADAGYELGFIGKWHLDRPQPPYVEAGPVVWDAYTPPERRHGFTFWYSYGTDTDHFSPHYWTNDAPWNQPLTVNEWSPRHEADVAIAFLRNLPEARRDRVKPFCLFVAMNPPHPPWDQVPQEYVEPYRAMPVGSLLTRPNVDLNADTSAVRAAMKGVSGYFGAITGVDDQVGRILRCLDEEGLADQTIVLFTSDHGEMLGSHGRIGKWVWYEESVGIPLLIRWPGVIRPRRDDMIVSVPDVMPTLLGLLGLGSSIPSGVQGEDLSRVLVERAPCPSRSAIYREPGGDPRCGARGIRTASHTYIQQRRFRGGAATHLYDNRRDPFQMRNVADQAPGLARELHQEMLAALERIGDPWIKTPVH